MRYKANETKSFYFLWFVEVEMDKNRVWCPKAGCDTVCLLDANLPSSSTASYSSVIKSNNKGVPHSVKCPTCSEEFCSACKKTVIYKCFIIELGGLLFSCIVAVASPDLVWGKHKKTGSRWANWEHWDSVWQWFDQVLSNVQCADREGRGLCPDDV